MTPEMRTPLLIRTLQAVPRVSAIEGFYCIPIDICLTFKYNQSLTPDKTNVSNTNEEEQNSTACWTFQWTNSLLMNLIPGDILLAMDPTYTNMLYSNIIESYDNRRLFLNLHINRDSLGDNSLFEVYEQALALFLCDVSHSHNNYKKYIYCMHILADHMT